MPAQDGTSMIRADWMLERLRRSDLLLSYRGPYSAELRGASIDSRYAGAGEVFFALKGEHADGHRYAAQALEKAGAAVLSDEAVFAELAAERPERDLFLVRDVLDALQILAAARVEGIAPWTVGVTGSNGKTGTKNYCAAALSTLGSTVASRGNLNNLIGLPLSFFGLREGTEYLVAEMGCSGFGEIARIAELFAPVAGVITNIGEAHLEQLHDRRGVFRAKSELAAALPGDGLLVLNGDDDFADEMAALTPASRVRRYGFGKGNDLRLADLGPEGAGRLMRVEGRNLRLRSPMRHALLQAGAAWLLARELGADPRDLAEALEAAQPEGNRSALYRLGPWSIMDDSYNANPDSLRAALDWLGEVPCTGRRWAVLGDMLEMGEAGPRVHEEFGRRLAERANVGLFAYGPLCAGMAAEARENGLAVARHFDDHEALAAALLEALSDGDLLLVKGSRGMKMEKVIEALERSLGRRREAIR